MTITVRKTISYRVDGETNNVVEFEVIIEEESPLYKVIEMVIDRVFQQKNEQTLLGTPGER